MCVSLYIRVCRSYISSPFLCWCSIGGSSLGDVVSLEDYWRELAEQRRAALANTLMENEEVQSLLPILLASLVLTLCMPYKVCM